ncbi:MAG: LrgB family protein [Herpetosiphon sp.]
MERTLGQIWVYLAQTPLLWLTVTIGAYLLADRIYRRSNALAVFNPVLLTIAVVVALLLATRTSYQTYFDGAQFVHFLLGPATVALAIPLRQRASSLQKLLLPLLGALLVGSLVAVLSSILLGRIFGVSRVTLLSLLPKSVTTAIAMGISEKVGGLPSLTAVVVILTGITGAVAATSFFDLLRVRDDVVRGFAIGVASHGIGTARAFQMGEEAGAFAGLALGLNGAVSAIVVPLLVRLLGI